MGGCGTRSAGRRRLSKSQREAMPSLISDYLPLVVFVILPR